MKVLLVVALAAVASAATVPQNPQVLDALRILRGNRDLTPEQIFELIANAVPGKDYPLNNAVPESKVLCSSRKQPGFYADTTAPSRCQAFHRCDDNGNINGFLCPNGTLFNQITLVCDWFLNVDCSQSARFEDYSNSRLADQDAVLLDTQDVYAYTGAAL